MSFNNKTLNSGGKMKREIMVNSSVGQTRVAIMEDGILSDIFIERSESAKIVGNIYKASVENILPGISSAFLDAGLEKNAYIFVDDVRVNSKERKIEKLLTRSQEVMIQIDKEPISTKGPKVTMDISLPGRNLVYMPFSSNIGISKNIFKKDERDRLRSIVMSARPDDGGFIIRTEAEGASEKELKREIIYLHRLWGSIGARFNKAKAPALLHKDLGVTFQTVRDYLNEDVEVLLIDDEEEFKDVKNFVNIVSPELVEKIKLYNAKTPLFKAFGIEETIKKLRSHRVSLPSGGSIIIQEAESLCAIDVNTGKFAGKKSQEETVTANNIEAAKEIAKQLRLRNIGGIIVIDFIDMKKSKNRAKVLEAMSVAVKGDKAKINILPITRLGLIEMTRERRRESLLSQMTENCPECGGTGLVLSRETLFIHICDELSKMRLSEHNGKVKIRLRKEVAEYFKERIPRLKKISGSNIEIQHAPELPWEDYQIIVE